MLRQPYSKDRNWFHSSAQMSQRREEGHLSFMMAGAGQGAAKLSPPATMKGTREGSLHAISLLPSYQTLQNQQAWELEGQFSGLASCHAYTVWIWKYKCGHQSGRHCGQGVGERCPFTKEDVWVAVENMHLRCLGFWLSLASTTPFLGFVPLSYLPFYLPPFSPLLSLPSTASSTPGSESPKQNCLVSPVSQI